MRLAFAIAVTALSLAGCREPTAGNEAANGQAGNAAANVAEAGANPLGAPVGADQAKKIMHDRHENMEDIGDATKAVGRTLKSSSPDLGVIRNAAATYSRLSPHVASWFPPGTGPEVGKTHAKAEIWQKPEDFAAKARDFDRAAQAFKAAADSGDLNQIKDSFAPLGKSCKACHDSYRAKVKD